MSKAQLLPRRIVQDGRAVVVVPEVAPPRLDPVKLDLPVLYDDAHSSSSTSRRGIAVHPGAGGEGTTIVHGLLHQVSDLRGVGGELRPGIVHRLDKDTSGCLVVAKSEMALRALQAAFKAREVEKGYRALVHGAPPDRLELATAWPPSGAPQALLFPGAGRKARDHALLGALAHPGRRIPGCELFTGRTAPVSGPIWPTRAGRCSATPSMGAPAARVPTLRRR